MFTLQSKQIKMRIRHFIQLSLKPAHIYFQSIRPPNSNVFSKYEKFKLFEVLPKLSQHLPNLKLFSKVKVGENGFVRLIKFTSTLVNRREPEA